MVSPSTRRRPSSPRAAPNLARSSCSAPWVPKPMVMRVLSLVSRPVELLAEFAHFVEVDDFDGREAGCADAVLEFPETELGMRRGGGGRLPSLALRVLLRRNGVGPGFEAGGGGAEEDGA